MKHTFSIFTLLFAALATLADGTGFDRYQVILDKNMFGSPRPTPRPVRQAPPPAAPVVSWAKDYRVTMMVQDERSGDVQVGIQNVQNNTGFLLRTEDPADFNGGFKLLRADFGQKIAVISYQGTQHQFTQEAGPTVPVEGNRPTAARGVRQVSSARSVTPLPPRVRVPRPTPVPVQPKYTGKELDDHLQRYNEQVIREGLPPLPIPLTPEQDARLVRDGVLPPQ